MSQQAPTSDELQHAVALLRGRGRSVDPIPGDKAGLYTIDGHISTAHDVVRHAVMAGMKGRRPVAGPEATPGEKR